MKRICVVVFEPAYRQAGKDILNKAKIKSP
jgi:hypothetical protein